jgi:hypothetical protein
MQILDYIVLPFASFYATDTPDDTMEQRRDGTYLFINKIQYPVLNKAIIESV